MIIFACGNEVVMAVEGKERKNGSNCELCLHQQIERKKKRDGAERKK